MVIDGRKMFSLNKFIDIMKDCRQQLIDDVLDGNPDLYKFLYEDKNMTIKLLYKKRYELKWLEMHWLKCQALLSDENIEAATRRELLRIFLQWYQKFVEAWGYGSSDAFFFNSNVEALEVLIESNHQWEATINKFQMSFLREKRILDKQIEEAKLL